MASVTICSNFGAKKTQNSHCFHCFPIYLPWSYGPICQDLLFWILSFKPAFSLSSFTLIKRLFNSSLLSAMKVVSSAYLKLLIFLSEILIAAYSSSCLEIHIMYFAYKLNKQDLRAFASVGRIFFFFPPVLDLCCGPQAFSSCGKQVLLCSCYEWASHCSGFSCGSWALGCKGFSSCDGGCNTDSSACGIFPDQGSNPCPLHWQVDS